MFGLGYQELLIILVIVLILFGANRLPELARSLGIAVPRRIRVALKSTRSPHASRRAMPRSTAADGAGLAGATTLLSALIARAAGGRGALLPVLLFPVLVPLLLSAVEATRSALLVAEGWAAATDELLTLVGFGGAVITAAVLLFDYIWLD